MLMSSPAQMPIGQRERRQDEYKKGKSEKLIDGERERKGKQGALVKERQLGDKVEETVEEQE